MRTLYFLLVILVLSSCKLADIRTPELKETTPDAASFVKGRIILEDAARKHGLAVWQKQSYYTATYEDQYFGLKGKIANPFPENPEEVQVAFEPKTSNGQLKILAGKDARQIWGMQDWKPYVINPDGTPNTKKKALNKTSFWVPTIQYFIELPFTILKADQIAFAGEQEFEGKQYDLVAVSWKTLVPQKDIDQYLFWINKETGMIEIVQYTVRDYYNFLVGHIRYEDLKDYDGVILPQSMPVGGKKLSSKKKLHHMRVKDLKFSEIPIPRLIHD